MMKDYDVIAIGTGSAMNIVEGILQRQPDKRIAVVDKDEPGGICLTRGCIPSKLLLYPAELLRLCQAGGQLGVHAEVTQVDFPAIMDRMRSIVGESKREIQRSFAESKDLDFYPGVAEFVGPYQLKVGTDTLQGKIILLCLGSEPLVPSVPGLEETEFYTSDTLLEMERLPASLAILGGGYIAAEYGHFFSAMGSKVTILGRNSQFLPQEEPEVSGLARQEMSKHMTVLTGHEVTGVGHGDHGKKRIVATQALSGKTMDILVDEVLVAAGRMSNTNLLHPERTGVDVDEKGWVVVDDHLQTTKANIWAFGDAIGRHLFKHAANYESRVVYYNAFLGQKVAVDHRFIPHAVFCHPEVASVGLRLREAVAAYGEDALLVGFCRYQDTAKGEAIGAEGCFVKVILRRENGELLGAHIIGPQASVLIQEIVTLMYTAERTVAPILQGMHIHPSLSEVVERACTSAMPVAAYDSWIGRG
jgi:dihydrolipoamide dehydrogenase